MKIEIDKPIVPKWFDNWYKLMKDAEHTDAFMIRAILSANHYGRYCDYSRDDGFFDKDQFNYISENFMNVINAIQFGYEVEQEPLYYAKIKGWKLIKREIDEVYWNLGDGDLFVSDNGELVTGGHHTKLTKQQWNELGINDANADFEVVE